MSDVFTVYALRCADGAVERHTLQGRSMHHLALIQLEKQDQRTCGPHVLMSAEISRTPWVQVDADAPVVDAREAVRSGARRYPCPLCAVAAGAPCENLAARRKGVLTANAWPHAERLALWNAGPS